jgi:hypothetical protein
MLPYFSFPRDSLGAECPDESMQLERGRVCRCGQGALVGKCPTQPILGNSVHVDDGVGYFAAAGERDRAEMDRSA